MVESIRLTFRLHRFELLMLGGFTALVVVAALVVAGRLDGLGYGPCAQVMETYTRSCEVLAQRFYAMDSREATPVLTLAAILPYAFGLFLGAPIVAREIERGTTRLAWSIAPSRLRWYVLRTAPIVVVVVLLAFVAGMAADRLFAARSPGVDISNAFDGYGYRGGLLAVQALVITAGALGLGSVIGRLLPTIILALVIGVLGIALVGKLHEQYTQREAIIVADDGEIRGARYIDQFFQLPDGRLVGWNELAEIDPAAMESEMGPQYPMVALVVPGERYREVEAREAVVLTGIAAVMLIGSGIIVQRRRPG